MMIQQIITIILAAAGLILMLSSLIGVIRFPDFITRLHAQGVGDTLGALLIILAMMTANGFCLMSLKIFLIFIIIMLTNPVGTNLMTIAAINYFDYQEYSRTCLRRPGEIDMPDEPDIPVVIPDEPDDPTETPVEPEPDVPAETPDEPDVPAVKPDEPEIPAAKKKSGLKPSMRRKKAELIAMAEELGIEVGEKATKKDILDLIMAANNKDE